MSDDGVPDVGEWYVSEGGHDSAARDQFRGAAGMVIGRKSYEGLAGYWPEQTGLWGDMLNPMPKFVASRTLTGPLEWNATLIDGDAVETIRGLKEEVDGDLFLIGCGELARDLLANGLVDEIRFWLDPAVWGEGGRAFQGEKLRMRLLDAEDVRLGRDLLRYEPLDQ